MPSNPDQDKNDQAIPPELRTSVPEPPEEDRGISVPDSPNELIGTIRRAIRQPENITLLIAFAAAAGVIWIGIEAAERAESFRKVVTQLIRAGIEGEIPASAEVKAWLATLVFLLVIAPIGLGIYSLAAYLQTRALRRSRDDLTQTKAKLQRAVSRTVAERNQLKGSNRELAAERDSLRAELIGERERVQTTLEVRTHRLQRTLEGGINAAVRIRDQLFPIEDRSTGKSFESVHFIYHIGKNFDAEVRRRYRIRAGESPLHFWQNSIRVPEEASPVETFADLNFRLISHDSGKDVVYLPTRNELHDKAACIFFLPRVESHTTRDIELAYSWPGMSRQLRKQGWEDFSVKLNSIRELSYYCVEIYLEPGTGGSLYCEEAGVLLPGKTLEPLTSYQGWPGWRYSAANIAAEHLDRRIALRVEWRKS